jgi:hypothetical protein
MFNQDIAQTLSSLNTAADSGLASNTSSASLEHRVRSYLDVNCAHCHTPGRTPTHFDARYHREENSIQPDWTTGSVLIPFEIDHAGLIVPKEPARSILLGRLDAGGGPIKMPPVEIATPDRTAIEHIRRWIDSMEGVEALAPPTLTAQVSPDEPGRHASVEVKIRHADPEAAIHYTLDRSDPTPDSPRLRGGLQLEESTTVTARAFRDGIRASVAVAEPFEVVRDAVPVDLQDHFTGTLDHGWHDPGRPNNHLQSLPKGRQPFAGVPFFIQGGVVQLHGTGIANDFPDATTGIEIQRELTTLYLFHGTASRVPDGTIMARLQLHYEDGSTNSIPIRYGDHVRDWWQSSEQPPTAANSQVAWRGSNPVTVEKRVQARLYMTASQNPDPQRKVQTVDYLSANTKAAPFLISLTTDAKQDYPPNADAQCVPSLAEIPASHSPK